MPVVPFVGSVRRTARTHAEIPRFGRVAGFAAWTWVIVFIAFHLYWYAGGRIGHPGELPDGAPAVFNVVVGLLFLAGAVVPLASVSRWGCVAPRWILLTALWTACVILALRGAAGVLDETLRVTGLTSTGLTGLTREQVTGSANPSAHMLWSGRAIDAYFLLGGVLFGWAARAFGRRTGVRRGRDRA